MIKLNTTINLVKNVKKQKKRTNIKRFKLKYKKINKKRKRVNYIKKIMIQRIAR